MSEPILPKRQWPAGIQQASVPANDNALRDEAMERPCIGVANDASGSDVNGDLWIVGDTPAGAFASFAENDVALYQFDSWYAWAPTDGLRLVVNDVRKVFDGTTWIDDPSGGGSGDVVGPASSVDSHVALFDGTTGKLLKDGGALGGMAGINDAPSDGTGYVRKSGAWVAESGGGGSDVLDVSSPTNSSGTVTLDFAGKSRYAGAITLAANVTTLAFSNLPGAGKYAEYELDIAQDATGGRTFAIPASHKPIGASDTAINLAANAVTVLTGQTKNNGTTWRYAMQESA